MSTMYLTEFDINRMRKARKEKGLTQQELAQMIGITDKTYSRIESGTKQKVDIEIVNKISHVLDISMEESEQMVHRTSITIPAKIKKDLELFKREKGFDSLSETILFCVTEQLTDFHLRKCSTQLMIDLQKMIHNTFCKEMEKLNFENNINKDILTKICRKDDINIEIMRQDFVDYLSKVTRSKKY